MFVALHVKKGMETFPTKIQRKPAEVSQKNCKILKVNTFTVYRYELCRIKDKSPKRFDESNIVLILRYTLFGKCISIFSRESDSRIATTDVDILEKMWI